MPQSHWERAFWAVARSDDFKPYPKASSDKRN